MRSQQQHYLEQKNTESDTHKNYCIMGRKSKMRQTVLLPLQAQAF